jgi:hypothetical protein
VRRATGAYRPRTGELTNVGRLAFECAKNKISAVGISARLHSLPRLVGNSARSALGSCGGVHRGTRGARHI